MLMVSGISEDSLKEKFAKINSGLDNDIHFAFGYYCLNKDDDIRETMRRADERMYADKNEYYAQHPEKKYR